MGCGCSGGGAVKAGDSRNGDGMCFAEDSLSELPPTAEAQNAALEEEEQILYSAKAQESAARGGGVGGGGVSSDAQLSWSAAPVLGHDDGLIVISWEESAVVDGSITSRTVGSDLSDVMLVRVNRALTKDEAMLSTIAPGKLLDGGGSCRQRSTSCGGGRERLLSKLFELGSDPADMWHSPSEDVAEMKFNSSTPMRMPWRRQMGPTLSAAPGDDTIGASRNLSGALDAIEKEKSSETEGETEAGPETERGDDDDQEEEEEMERKPTEDDEQAVHNERPDAAVVERLAEEKKVEDGKEEDKNHEAKEEGKAARADVGDDLAGKPCEEQDQESKAKISAGGVAQEAEAEQVGAFWRDMHDVWGIVAWEAPLGEAAPLAWQRWRRKDESSDLWSWFIPGNSPRAEWAELTSAIRAGVSAELRGNVWYRCVSADEERRASLKPYPQLVRTGHGLQNAASHVIEVDVPRAGSSVALQGPLRNILLAFAVRCPDIGYCQSMSMVVATLLLCCREEEAFWILCSLVKAVLPEGYYTSEMTGLRVDLMVLDSLILQYLPRLHTMLVDNDIHVSGMATQWFSCLFIRALPVAHSLRVLDCLLHEGPEVLFRVAMVILKIREAKLIQTASVCDMYALLHSPLDCSEAECLFDDLFGEWLGGLSMAGICLLREKHVRQAHAEDEVQQVKQAIAEAAELLAQADGELRPVVKPLKVISSHQMVDRADLADLLIREAQSRTASVQELAVDLRRRVDAGEVACVKADVLRLDLHVARFDAQLEKIIIMLAQVRETASGFQTDALGASEKYAKLMLSERALMVNEGDDVDVCTHATLQQDGR